MNNTLSSVVYKGSQFTIEQMGIKTAPGQRSLVFEVVRRQAAVAIVAHDDRDVWMVDVARPVLTTRVHSMYELPAGKVEPGEDPEETAKREFAEECGMGAHHWEHLSTFFASPGYTDEQIHVYLATDLYEERVERDPYEMLKSLRWPLSRLQELLLISEDGKSKVGLLMLQARLRTPQKSEGVST